MTSQEQADAALQHWQQLRALPPEIRIEVLMSEFFAPVPQSDVEYAATQRDVSEIMANG